VLHLHHTPAGEAYESIELSPIAGADGAIAYFVEKLQPLPVARGLGGTHRLVGRSPAFLRLMDLVARVAPSSAAVLLQGESGSGKELVAQAIHDASPRARHPFVVVDCSGLPETLIESELFGHERGAFTGATTRQLGLVEAASGGTLFLDEVGDIPLSMQVKLLRLLETGTYRRVGGTEWRHADIRLVSATHRDLRGMVDDRRFRQDLFYRLNAFPIGVPPLRDRLADLPELIAALLDRVAPGRVLALAPEALACLAAYPYPGNVRELRNLLERASLMCDGDTIAVRHLPDEVVALRERAPQAHGATGACTAPAEPATLRDIGREALRAILARHRGSRRDLARRLGISERTLYRRIRELTG
jgi:DNA-binding NtrC family response regulator